MRSRTTDLLIGLVGWAFIGAGAVTIAQACAAVKPVARTAVEAAKAACELFGEQAPEGVMGMSLDACIDHLLAGQRAAGGKR